MREPKQLILLRLTVQWITRRLSCRLLQLATPESLYSCFTQVEASDDQKRDLQDYLRVYFERQSHFSLKAFLDQAMEAVLKAGARLVKKPEKVFWGGYSGYFADPDGYLWELAYNPMMWVGPPAN